MQHRFGAGLGIEFLLTRESKQKKCEFKGYEFCMSYQDDPKGTHTFSFTFLSMCTISFLIACLGTVPCTVLCEHIRPLSG